MVVMATKSKIKKYSPPKSYRLELMGFLHIQIVETIGLELRYLTLTSGPLQKLFKLYPSGQKMTPAREGGGIHWISIYRYSENLKRLPFQSQKS